MVNKIYNLWEMKMFSLKTLFTGTALTAGLIIGGAAMAADTISASRIATPITLDGDASDWSGIQGMDIPLEGKASVSIVNVKAAINADMIYLLAVWQDGSENILHKPYKWDEASVAYKRTKEQEDRFAISFKMAGDFDANKLSGKAFTADVWHWKASRSEPNGIAHDKWWQVDTKPFEKAKKFKGENGEVYVARKSDGGSKLYKSVKYDLKEQETMPRYVLTENPSGSITDVKSKATWNNGTWTLELARKLDTGNSDDAVIPAEGSIPASIAVFNNVGGAKHSVSKTLMLTTGK